MDPYPFESNIGIEHELTTARSEIARLKERIKQLEKELSDVNEHRKRLIESAMAAWERVDDQ